MKSLLRILLTLSIILLTLLNHRTVTSNQPLESPILPPVKASCNTPYVNSNGYIFYDDFNCYTDLGRTSSIGCPVSGGSSGCASVDASAPWPRDNSVTIPCPDSSPPGPNNGGLWFFYNITSIANHGLNETCPYNGYGPSNTGQSYQYYADGRLAQANGWSNYTIMPWGPPTEVYNNEVRAYRAAGGNGTCTNTPGNGEYDPYENDTYPGNPSCVYSYTGSTDTGPTPGSGSNICQASYEYCAQWLNGVNQGPNAITALSTDEAANGGTYSVEIGDGDTYNKNEFAFDVVSSLIPQTDIISEKFYIWISPGLDGSMSQLDMYTIGGYFFYTFSTGQLQYSTTHTGGNQVFITNATGFHLSASTWHSIEFQTNFALRHIQDIYVDGVEFCSVSPGCNVSFASLPSTGLPQPTSSNEIAGNTVYIFGWFIDEKKQDDTSVYSSGGMANGYYYFLDDIDLKDLGSAITSTTTVATVVSTEVATSSSSTTATLQTVVGSATTTVPGAPVITNTLDTTTTTTGAVAGTSTSTFTSPMSTSYSTDTTDFSTVSSSELTTETGTTTIGTVQSQTTTSTGTMLSTTTSSGTVSISETDTFNVLLTNIYQELDQFADEVLQLLGFQVTATPVGQEVNQVVVTVTTPSTSTTSDTFLTSTQDTTTYTSTTSTKAAVVGSTTTTVSQLPLITNTLSTTITVTGPVAGTTTTTFTSPLSTSYTTTSTATSSTESSTETGTTTTGTIQSQTTTSAGTLLSTTTSAGTVTVSETDTFNVLLTQIYQSLNQFEAFILQTLGFQVTATPVGQQVNQVIVTVTTPTTGTTSMATVTSFQSTTTSVSTTSTFSTITGSTTLSAVTNGPLVTGTTLTTSTITGPTAGTATSVYTSILSTSTSTSLTTSSVGATTSQTDVTTVSTGTLTSTTSTGTAFTSATSGGTVTATQTDTFNVLLTTVYQELHQFADEIFQLLGFQVTVTPVGQQVNQVVVTVTMPTMSTISSTTVTSSLTSTSSTSSTTNLLSTFTVTSSLSATTNSPAVTKTTTIRTTTTGLTAGTSTTTVTSILTTATSTSRTTISTGRTTMVTGTTTTGTATATSTSSTTAFSTTTAAGTVTVSQTNTFTDFVTTIIHALLKFVNEVLKLVGTQSVATPKGQKIIRIIKTVK